jgi:hypothetical protein
LLLVLVSGVTLGSALSDEKSSPRISYHTDHTENEASNNFIIVCVLIATVMIFTEQLPSTKIRDKPEPSFAMKRGYT